MSINSYAYIYPVKEFTVLIYQLNQLLPKQLNELCNKYVAEYVL